MKNQLPIFNFAVRNTSADTMEINIDGEIVDASTQAFLKEWWGDDTSVSFKSFRDQVNAAVASGIKTINGYINSVGGMVTEAMAMHDFIIDLQNRGIVVNMTGRGIIASAATYVLMASRNSAITENSFFMIHNVSGYAYGDVNEVENQARTLRKFNNTIRDFYATSTGLAPETVSSMMNKETWLNGQETKEKGFVKNVSTSEQFFNSIKPDQWMFNNTAVLNAYNSFTPQNKEEMDLKKITDAITNGFNNLKGKISNSDSAEVTAVLNDFQTNLTNAITEAMPTDEKIQDLVNKAVNTALESVPQSFSEAINNSIKENTKGLASGEDVTNLKEEIKNIQEDVRNKVGPARPQNKEGGSDSKFNHSGISFEG